MPSLIKLPTPLTILMAVTVLAAIATWLMPAGKFESLSYQNNAFVISGSEETKLPATQHILDSLGIMVKADKFLNGAIKKPVSIPGSFHPLLQNGQSVIDVVQAPLKGIYETVDVILFILIIGSFIQVFYATGAMEAGIAKLSAGMKGRESWLIVVLTFLFALGGSSYGMAEESLVFYPILIPLFLAAGYDLLIPVAVIHGGNTLGYLSSFSNPFSTIIASNAAGISWTDGLYGRLAMLLVSSVIYIGYVMWYAQKVRRNPHASYVTADEGRSSIADGNGIAMVPLKGKTAGLLFIFAATFVLLIIGVVALDWWLLEMSALFLVASVLVAVVQRMSERLFIEKFIEGAESLLGVAFVIGAARGVTVVLDAGNISGSVLHWASTAIQDVHPALFIIGLLLIYILLTVIIPSSSGMAVMTMPILGSLAIVAGIPGREIVNSYLLGMGIMGFITPTGLILPSLALAGVGMKAWIRFIWPVLLLLFMLAAMALLTGLWLDL
ncbi:hypothetical protein DYBT9275_03251 [Dyadobacter sp. CECT 9275]|uniref:YfcC family protein n=1 Tax=Dyadobacter helix TaxID=2822344 RepID=A0A916NM21_9BACT|nr:YfcC family protein [Dyadobacter sp. CECT 9275]CAG5003886.1 hypothetical protein DYBT9275_03251 [Dyadobacter sp. CECT 9275]